MKNFNQIANFNAQGANERAQLANANAQKARGYRDTRDTFLITLKEWERIMINCAVKLFTIAFFLLALFEIIISWPGYQELTAGVGDRPNMFLSLLLGVAIVTAGAVVSHLIGKKISRSLFELEVFNMSHSSKYSTPNSKVEETVRADTQKQFLMGLVVYFVVAIVVLAISFQRVGLMGAITGQNYGFVQKLLPAIVITLEVFAGIYLVYVFKRLAQKRKIAKLNKKFVRARSDCAYETRLCHDLVEHATARSENIVYNLELRDALYR